MNKSFLLPLITIAFCLNVKGQSCLPNGINFYNQFDIDNFPVNHPNCTVIEGNVYINAFGDITNLNGLNGITAIGGYFNVGWAPTLSDLSGLQHVTSIKHLILNNTGLTSLNGLQNLTSLETLTISGFPGNATLTSLNGIQGLTSLQSLQIQSTLITSLNGLENLTSLETLNILENPLLTTLNGVQNITALKNLSINSNTALTSLSGLSNLTSLENLTIQWNSSLPALNGIHQITALKSLAISSPLFVNLNELQQLTSLDSLTVSYCDLLTSLSGISNITSLKGLVIINNAALPDLSGLEHLTALNNLFVRDNAALTTVTGLESLTTLDNIIIDNNPLLTSLEGFSNITGVDENFYLTSNTGLMALNGLDNLAVVGGNLIMEGNPSLTNLTSLSNIKSIEGSLSISSNSTLATLHGLENITSIGGNLDITANFQLTSLDGLQNLSAVGRDLSIGYNFVLPTLHGLDKITAVGGAMNISNNGTLTNLSGLDHLAWVGGFLVIQENPSLTSLDGLAQLTSIGNGTWTGGWSDTLIGTLRLYNNPVLTSLNGLSHLTAIKKLEIIYNDALSECSIFPVCNLLFNEPHRVEIHDNAMDCNSRSEVQALCNSIPIVAEVFLDYNGNCGLDAGDTPISGIRVKLSGTVQMALRPTDSNGMVRFGYVDNGPFSLTLPQADSNEWEICQSITTLVGSNGNDSVHAFILLTPLSNCPKLTVDLGLPSFFRSCLVTSDLEISTRNTGTATAQGIKAAIVLPSVLELLASVPPAAAQIGDTLYFNLADIPPFETAKVLLKVKTSCDTVLLAQTLCIETFATLENACPVIPIAFSEIKLSVECLGDTSVRFTIKNIGDAPTLGWHEYRIIRNEAIQYNNAFQLNAQQSLVYQFPADGATWRMEATKFDNGTETAVALENCGGLTPGLITAFWLDQGPLEYDFDCRQVIGSYDPNLKSAVPTGTLDWPYTIAPNHSMLYTIDFQNTGTDTAFRVLLRDILPNIFNLNTFRPIAFSHPCTWEIRGTTLEVLFSPIALPDSNTNEPASHGFFSFELDQKPNLSDNTNFSNTASIIFDFNPAIYTNTVYHHIGQLLVQVDEPQRQADLWQVRGNPTRDIATFQSLADIAGEKLFELYDVSGRVIRSVTFSGQSFSFQRQLLQAGVYVFRISDKQDRTFSGKIVVTD